MNKPHRFAFSLLVALCVPTLQLHATPVELTLKSFIQRATQTDVVFEAILADQMAIQYRRDALLPDSDIILSLKHQYNFYIDQDRGNPEASLSLSKLFPLSGTDISLSYSKSSSIITTTDEAGLQLLVSQPIAKNAFGKGTRLLDQAIGVQNDILRHQIIEAYEDYLAGLSTIYYNWYSAYENLRLGRASLQSSEKLLENILARQRQKIALPIDVNKMRLLLIGKRENLVVLQEIHDTLANLINKSIGHPGGELIPVKPELPVAGVNFNADYNTFTQTSRTYRILRLLEQEGTLEVKKAADDLLPSTNLLLGYKLEGEDWGIRDREASYFAGISISWPLGRRVDTAKYKLAQIEHKKTVLSNRNKYEELHTNLKNLYLQIQREQKLIDIAAEKIKLAAAILRDEAENYSFGKVSLNDYLTAVNQLDQNRFNLVEHSVRLNKLSVEWLRLTDRLVDESVLENRKPQAPVNLPH
ncbi:MAG: TolC family protein [Gammaproteobacteria bacterium]|nr:TolC family protein [Gammaproteobacteria bacterium]MDH5653877.1 TolC family protein [Gammaproteobacteria bacterium]